MLCVLERPIFFLLPVSLSPSMRSHDPSVLDCFSLWSVENTHVFRERNVQANMLQVFCLFFLSLFFYYKQSLFKATHVTRRPSLKRLSGIQVQLLSLCMGEHQILQNCSLRLR